MGGLQLDVKNSYGIGITKLGHYVVIIKMSTAPHSLLGLLLSQGFTVKCHVEAVTVTLWTLTLPPVTSAPGYYKL